MLNKLEEVWFQSIHVYEEGHSHFYTPWQFLVAFKDSSLKGSWYRNAAEIEIELHQRLFRTNSGKPAIRYFDGSIMSNYQMPPKVVATNHCRKGDDKLECHPPFVNNSSHVEDIHGIIGDAGATLGVSGSAKWHFLPNILAIHPSPFVVYLYRLNATQGRQTRSNIFNIKVFRDGCACSDWG